VKSNESLQKDLKTSDLIAKQENGFIKQQYEMIDIDVIHDEHIYNKLNSGKLLSPLSDNYSEPMSDQISFYENTAMDESTPRSTGHF